MQKPDHFFKNEKGRRKLKFQDISEIGCNYKSGQLRRQEKCLSGSCQHRDIFALCQALRVICRGMSHAVGERRKGEAGMCPQHSLTSCGAPGLSHTPWEGCREPTLSEYSTCFSLLWPFPLSKVWHRTAQDQAFARWLEKETEAVWGLIPTSLK